MTLAFVAAKTYTNEHSFYRRDTILKPTGKV
jgi:hypothetical protein